ncbi:hypothetical protein ACL9RL_01380 [Plantibacter sp. Mn2098]|uniref:hypothetical protein n=1 Tax=Plantibacter sp. Mn2098 TaxID=3395266 RepID=UPI003BBD38D1
MSTRRGRSRSRSRAQQSTRERFFGSRQRQILAIVGIGLFVAIDVVLIALALQSVKPTPTTETPRTPSGFGAEFDTPSPTPSPTPSSTPPAAAAQPSAARFLVAGDASTLWRATAGSCTGTRALIERSVDAGATWQPLTTGTFDVRAVYALTATNATDVRIVGATDAACTPGAFVSYTSGDFWAVDANALAGASYLQADAAGASVSALINGATVPPACDAMQQLVTTSTGPTVVCADGLHTWNSSTSTWSTTPLSGVRAAAAGAAGADATRLAIIGSPGCTGVSVQELDATPTATTVPATLGCAATAGADGAIALAGSGASLWVWSGDAVVRSLNSGNTWI